MKTNPSAAARRCKPSGCIPAVGWALAVALAACGGADKPDMDVSALPEALAEGESGAEGEGSKKAPGRLPASVLQSAQFDVSGVELARIALALSQHPSARQYAFGQSSEHNQLLVELSALARSSQQELMYEMEPVGAQQAAQLQYQSTSHFDRDYLLQQINLQNAAISALSVAAQEDLDQTIRQWVDKALQIWRRDQVWVRQVHEAVLIGY